MTLQEERESELVNVLIKRNKEEKVEKERKQWIESEIGTVTINWC